MQRRDFIALLGSAFSSTFAAHAQQQTMPVIGFLSGASGPGPDIDGLGQGLAEGGYEDRAPRPGELKTIGSRDRSA